MLGAWHIVLCIFKQLYDQGTIFLFYRRENWNSEKEVLPKIPGLVSRRVYIQTRICLPDLKDLLFPTTLCHRPCAGAYLEMREDANQNY